MKKINFIINGEPIAQKRHRHHRWGVYDPSAKDKQHTKKVIHPHIPSVILKGAIVLHLDFYCTRPKYHYGTGKNSETLKKKYELCYKIGKPDIDNYIKFYMDVFTKSGFFNDDAQVIRISSSKKYANTEPRTEVMIVELN